MSDYKHIEGEREFHAALDRNGRELGYIYRSYFILLNTDDPQEGHYFFDKTQWGTFGRSGGFRSYKTLTAVAEEIDLRCASGTSSSWYELEQRGKIAEARGVAGVHIDEIRSVLTELEELAPSHFTTDLSGRGEPSGADEFLSGEVHAWLNYREFLDENRVTDAGKAWAQSGREFGDRSYCPFRQGSIKPTA